MRYLGFILVLLVALSSCDSREDWFAHNSEGPGIVVTKNGVSDTLYKGDPKLITIDLHVVSCDERGWQFFSDTINFKLEGLNDGKGWPLQSFYSEESFSPEKLFRVARFNEDYCVNGECGAYLAWNSLDSDENHVIEGLIYESYGRKDYDSFFESDTTAKILDISKSVVLVTDGFGNREYYNVMYYIFGPIPPNPVLKTEKLSSDYEYSLSLEGSYDRDGKVAKYEWCIDGNIVPYSDKDNRFDVIEGNWKSGKAAYGGTYITATSLSRINHSFQTSGEHTVYYRCMDDMGIWSMWYSKKINVE